MSDTGTRPGGSEGKFRLLVAIGNPSNAVQLMRTGVDVARDRDGTIHVLTVVLQSRESPFALLTDETIKRDFGRGRQALLDRALDAVNADVPVSGEVRVGSNLADTITETMRERSCDAVLVGWHDRGRTDVVFGSDVDRVAATAPGDVIVERIGVTADGVDSILVPTAASPHVDLAAEVARAIAVANDASVEVLHVLRAEATDADRETAAGLVDSIRTRLEPVAVERTVVASDDVVAAVVDAAEHHDITVVGATRKHRLRRLVVDVIPQEVCRRSECTVIITRRNRTPSGSDAPFFEATST